MDKSQLAAEAQRIKENEALQKALADIRRDALEALVLTPATDTETIRNHQTTARVVHDFLARIEATIRDGQPRKQAGIV
jgi:hypothetical protein